VSTSDKDDAGIVDFPPPLTSMQRTKRAIEFYKRVLPVLAAYKAKELEFKLKKTPEEEQQRAWQELDEWGSTRIAETIHDMKGFYVKTGQVISTRVDLFPEAYTSKLQELQDSIEPMPF
jgi:aarF domain-containing kinase